MYKIPIYIPFIDKEEENNVMEAVKSTWISSKGEFITKFENKFSDIINRKHSLGVCNGTVALDLAVNTLDLSEKCGIICPSLTYVSSANVIYKNNKIPIFVDCNKSGVIDSDSIEKGIYYANKENVKVECMIPVHLYGNMVNIEDINNNFRGIKIIEDCAESFGSYFENKICGDSLSDICCYSFFGNKTITTGEGGMVSINDDNLFEKAAMLRGVGQKTTFPQRYYHIYVGYNYRMTNITAAIGLAQLNKYKKILELKVKIYNRYNEIFKNNNLDILLKSSKNVDSNYWLVTILLNNNIMRDSLLLYLESKKIETRPAFFPMHAMINLGKFIGVKDYTNTENISQCGLNLPSYPGMNDNDVDFVAEQIISFFKLY